MNKINSSLIEGCFKVIYEGSVDSRGKFTRVFDCKDIPFYVSQTSLVTNTKKGTLRGMHLQNYPKGESKVITCVSGSMRLFVVDLRGESETFLNVETFDLFPGGEYTESVFVPKYCATGYQTVLDNTKILYMMDAPYDQEFQTGFNIFDPGINLPIDPCFEITMSDRDRRLESLPVKPR